MITPSLHRCPWCGTDELYVEYHDKEWRRQVKDDQTLFEFLILESAQAGVSWITILRKREGYRKNFAEFDAKAVSKFTEVDVEEILKDPGIIRNRAKVQSAINNAKVFLTIQQQSGSFFNYLYSFMPNGSSISNNPKSIKDIPTTSLESISI